MVTQGAEDELREEQEDCQELRQELAEAQTTLLEWDEWYDTEYLPLLEQQEEEHSFAETNALFRSFNPGNAEEEATQGAMAAKPLPQSSPLTPAVQQSSLNSSHLPPPSLPFQKKAPRVSVANQWARAGRSCSATTAAARGSDGQPGVGGPSRPGTEGCSS